MNGLRLEIDLAKIKFNTGTLTDLLAAKGISVTGITKATLGSPEVAKAMLGGGCEALGDSRIENIMLMHQGQISSEFNLIRTPMLSQVNEIVRSDLVSFNSDLIVISHLSAAATRLQRVHNIILMIELGDRREGIMLESVIDSVKSILALPNICLKGIATNLACRNGVVPDQINMDMLSSLANEIELNFNITLEIVSGGNSANLRWIFGNFNVGRINNLRLGESILLGREALNREPIKNLHLDAFSLIAEVIESIRKPSIPFGKLAQTSSGDFSSAADVGLVNQTILAVGNQDTDTNGLTSRDGYEIIGSSSDHLIVDSKKALKVGSEIAFDLNYSALMRAMASPFVQKVFFHK